MFPNLLILVHHQEKEDSKDEINFFNKLLFCIIHLSYNISELNFPKVLRRVSSQAYFIFINPK